MKSIFFKLFLSAILALVYFGCKKPENYPVVPSIQFKSLEILVDTTTNKEVASVITISFIDGDGDIGETTDKTTKDFIVSFFQRKNGAWVEDLADECDTCTGFSGRLPYLSPEGANKALKGDISMQQQLAPNVVNDTIHYTVYIVDRAGNKSNTITTSDVVINTR